MPSYYVVRSKAPMASEIIEAQEHLQRAQERIERIARKSAQMLDDEAKAAYAFSGDGGTLKTVFSAASNVLGTDINILRIIEQLHFYDSDPTP